MTSAFKAEGAKQCNFHSHYLLLAEQPLMINSGFAHSCNRGLEATPYGDRSKVSH